MATTEVSATNLSISREQGTYFPAIPPRVPKYAVSYSKYLDRAPRTALAGVVVDGRKPERHPVSFRDRQRRIVGYSNRWRLPESLGSDLLGSSQAVRAISHHMNHSMMHIISAENPKLTVNSDMTKPYQYRANDRPITSFQTGQSDLYASQTSLQKVAFSEPPCTASYKEAGPVPSSAPPSTRKAKPIDVFQYHSKQKRSATGPDVLLQCLDMNWELHRPMLQKSDTLSELLESAAESTGPTKYYKNKMSETLDDYIGKSSFYSNEYREMSNRLSTTDITPEDEQEKTLEDSNAGVKHSKHISEQRVVNNMTVIKLDIKDPLVTRHALAVALGNLYHEHLEVEIEDVVGVLAAAHILRFHQLVSGCAKMMLNSISCRKICSYHEVAEKYHQDHLQSACERWLELNLVPKMAIDVELRNIPMNLMQKILQSNRLFTTNEFSLYKVIVYWIFLQLNPSVQIMPSYSTVLTYFNSLPKANSLIESENGQIFSSLFKAMRLHGITDTNHLQDVQTMNILPQSWIIKILSQHYHSLQGGGDMESLTNFHSSCIRQGFVIEEEPHYHSEIFSLHGFHFELKSLRQNMPGCYSFYMQRLKPSDPVLSFRQCERSTFSMRADRDVRYAIRVQYFDDDNQVQTFNTGMLTQRFGLAARTSKSQVVHLENLKTPIFVTFAVLFPAS